MKRRILGLLTLLILSLGITAHAYGQNLVYLTMDYNGGKLGDSSSMTLPYSYGDDMTQLFEPSRSGYRFGGWYTDAACTKPWMDKIITGHTTIYAKWLTRYDISPSLDNFTQGTTYRKGTFTDVVRGSWYEENVAAAYELGLMKGSSSNTFNVTGNVTVAEAITMAARLHSIYFTGTEQFVQSGNTWYQTYVTYALDNDIINRTYDSYNRAVTRGEFAEIFCNALPGRALVQSNNVENGVIPDIEPGSRYWDVVYCLYRAGILTGSDQQGTFHPYSTISRTEAAAIVTRMAEPNLRKSFALIQQHSMTEFLGVRVADVANELGWDFDYADGWWYGAAKPFGYADGRSPYLFFFTDLEYRGYALGEDLVTRVEYYPDAGDSCLVAPGLRSNLTYNEIKRMNLKGEFAYIEGDMGNTAAFWYDYDAHTTIVFYWYGNLSPYTTQAGSVALMYH